MLKSHVEIYRNMRIISGTHKDKKIEIVKGAAIRATMSKVREAVFNLIMHSKWFDKDLSQMDFLDLFAGSGSVGIEAVSRGAKSVTAIDIETKCIRNNVSKLDLQGRINILDRNILKLDDSIQQYDVVFMDPPYSTHVFSPSRHIVTKTLKNLHRYSWLKKDSVVIVEKSKKDNSTFEFHDFKLVDQRNYGSSSILIFVYEPQIIASDNAA